MSGSGARVALLLPCHDDGRLVAEAVRSIDEPVPVEVAVVDDHSSDPATLAALAELEAEGVNVLRHSSNLGPAAARMTALRATVAPYVFSLDADDLAVPGALTHMADLLDGHPDAGVCFGDYAEFGDHEVVRAVPHALDPFRIAYLNEYPVASLFRRRTLEAVGGWRPVLEDAFGYEDWNLWMTLAERGVRGIHAGPGVLTHRRRLHGARLHGVARRRHRDRVLALRRGHPRLFAALRAHRRRSDLPRHRKLIYPLLYSARPRFGFEPRVKRALDRLGVWTLRREPQRGTMRLSPRPVREAKALATHARSLAWLARRSAVSPAGVRILFYHRVSDECDALAVPVARFREQMESLAADGFRALEVTAAARHLVDREPAAGAGRVIGLSFDDGYRDVAENALPVLEELGFSATVFVATRAVDGDVSLSWYERQPPLLGWEEIERLDAGGTLRFEAHTETHPNLLALSDEAVRSELAASKATLESHLGRPVRAFCYPGGFFGERERRLAAEAGFELAFTCEPGANDASSDRFALSRTQIEAGDRLFDFRAKAGGGHDTPLPVRALYRRLRYGARRSRDDGSLFPDLG